MTREMEYAKCIALLRKLVRKELLSEKEYAQAKRQLMDRYLVSSDNEKGKVA